MRCSGVGIVRIRKHHVNVPRGDVKFVRLGRDQPLGSRKETAEHLVAIVEVVCFQVKCRGECLDFILGEDIPVVL